MESFPDKVLMKIFTYFDIKTVNNIIAEVSPRWKRLALDVSSNIRHIKVESDEDYDFIEKLPTKHLMLSVEIGAFANDDMVNRLIKYLPNLTDLVVRTVLFDDTIAAISACCPRLKRFDFTPKYGYNQQFLDAIRFLEVVVLHQDADSEIVQWMADNCVNLREVHFYGVHQSNTSESIAALLRARHSHLSKLTMRNLPEDAYETIAKCPNLKELRLYGCHHLSTSDLVLIAALRRLSALHLTEVKKIKKAHFNEFIEALDVSLLIELNLSGTPFSDHNAECFAKKNSNILQVLVLSKCDRLTSKGVLCLALNLKHLVTFCSDKKLPEDIVQEIYDKSTLRGFRFL